MFTEAINKNIKYNHLNRNRNNRLDLLFNVLIKFHKICTYKIDIAGKVDNKINKGFSYQMNMKHHRKALNTKRKIVQVESDEENDQYKIKNYSIQIKKIDHVL